MKNRFIALFLFALLVLSFAGCSVNTTSSDTYSSLYTDTIISKTESTSESSDNYTTSSTEKEKPAVSETVSVGSGVASKVDLSSIPEYSGNAFVVINNNIPNFSLSELTTAAYERYSSLDSLGRCGVAIASCGKEIMPSSNESRGSISHIYPAGWKQTKYSGIYSGYLWNRCHPIGWQLSAENANRDNLITGTRYMNVNGMLPFENMVADYIKESDNHVAYRITPIFEGNNLVCSGVQMEAFSIEDNGEICFNIYCYNIQPGITINYANGDSSEPASEQTSKSFEATPTPAPSQPEASEVTPPSNNISEMVWIPKTGSRFHLHSGCSNMKNPSQVIKYEAVNRGYEPCKKCYK